MELKRSQKIGLTIFGNSYISVTNKDIEVIFFFCFKEPNEGLTNQSFIFHNFIIVTEIQSEFFSVIGVGGFPTPIIYP